MPNDSIRTSIRTLVESVASQLEDLVRQAAIEHVESALGGLSTAAPARRSAARGRKPGRPARSGKRSSGDMDAMQDRLLAHVKANPGQRGEQIARALGSDVTTIRLPMKKLIAARKVTTKGQRRGMTYSPGGRGAAPAARAAKATKRAKKSRRTTAKRAARKMRRIRKAKGARRKPATQSTALAPAIKAA